MAQLLSRVTAQCQLSAEHHRAGILSRLVIQAGYCIPEITLFQLLTPAPLRAPSELSSSALCVLSQSPRLRCLRAAAEIM